MTHLNTQPSTYPPPADYPSSCPPTPRTPTLRSGESPPRELRIRGGLLPLALLIAVLGAPAFLTAYIVVHFIVKYW